MRVVIACDKFKGSLTAPEACRIIADAIRGAVPAADVREVPMADGGEGTARTLLAALGGDWVEAEVTGPLPNLRVRAGYAWLPATRTAVVEMAAASGLALVPPARRNPLLTTTRGTGELLRAAVAHGARTVWLAVGGSATVDGGAGAAAALGWRFWDAAGAPIEPVGGTLRRITRIEPPPAPFGCAVEVLCDVDSPLCGPHGAAAVFGPQKGATPAAVRQLDDGLRHLAALIERELGKQVADLPGAGAAGGLGAGAAAFLDARLVSGAESIIRAVGLADHAAGAVWLVTGEGCLDSQSLRGKVVARVAALGRQQGCRVAAFAGMVLLSELQSQAAGIDRAVAITPPDLAWREALQKAPSLLAAAAGRFAAEYLA